jgi:major membrane immunogen (membrane-anchored lipoprotein)
MLLHFMKNAIITGAMAASILLAGCSKESGSPGSTASPTNTPADAASSSVTQATVTAEEIQKPPSDAELRQKVTGVWKYNHKSLLGNPVEDTFTFAPNGNYAKQVVIIHGTERKNYTGFGTWQIKDGVLTTTVTKFDPMPQGVIGHDIAAGGMLDQHKIVSVNDHELVIEIDVYTITGNGGHSKTKGTIKWTR